MASGPHPTARLTYADYLLLPEGDGKHYEIIDGELFVNPSPATYHQTLSRRIQFQLYVQVEEAGRGQVFDAPTCLHLSEVDIMEPDLIVVLEGAQATIERLKIVGVPALVVEILSPSTRRKDRVAKRARYERAGVPEYWIVDPDAHVVEQLVLLNGAYQLAGRQADAIRATHFDAHVDLRRVW
jgi:Uma2 family endonuclease